MARDSLGQPRQRVQIRLQVAQDRIVDDGSASRPNRGDLVATVVVGDEDDLALLKSQCAEQVINAAAS